jgi:hypothetical protein
MHSKGREPRTDLYAIVAAAAAAIEELRRDGMGDENLISL